METPASKEPSAVDGSAPSFPQPPEVSSVPSWASPFRFAAPRAATDDARRPVVASRPEPVFARKSKPAPAKAARTVQRAPSVHPLDPARDARAAIPIVGPTFLERLATPPPRWVGVVMFLAFGWFSLHPGPVYFRFVVIPAFLANRVNGALMLLGAWFAIAVVPRGEKPRWWWVGFTTVVVLGSVVVPEIAARLR